MQEYAELAAAGKYHQLTEKVLSEVPGMSLDDLSSLYNRIIVPNYYSLHDDSFAEISSAISRRMQPEDALTLLEQALARLVDSEKDAEEEEASLLTKAIRLSRRGKLAVTKLLLDIAHKQILLGNASAARIILYDCKLHQMEDKETLQRFHLGMGLLYYQTKDYTPAHKHLLEYLEISEMDRDVFEQCLVSGVLSDHVYSFSVFSSLPAGDGPAKDLAIALEEGNPAAAAECAGKINPELVPLAQKKALAVCLLAYFFRNQQRVVSLPWLSSELSFPLPELQAAVLDILGNGIMKGSIDGITGDFTYNWIGYKYLTASEISTVRSVVSEMKRRVEGVIKEVQLNRIS